MDRMTIQQIDRIEEKIDYVLKGNKVLLDDYSKDILKGFYEEEIENEKGNLHYLAKDSKLREFFDKLDEEEVKIDEEEKGFENKAFR